MIKNNFNKKIELPTKEYLKKTNKKMEFKMYGVRITID